MELIIDGQSIPAQPGATIFEAARDAGIEIPTLCRRDGIEPNASCFLCAVRVQGHETLQPSCATRVVDGMRVEVDTDEVLDARRTALELLFSDHAGRCEAPCATACPAHFDVAGFMRLLAAGRQREAATLARDDLVLPATLGVLCPAYCEKTCVRKDLDQPLAIRDLHRSIVDIEPAAPRTRPATGYRVAIQGAGPVGLAAAWFLLRQGHSCDLYDTADAPGGLLRQLPDEKLDKKLLDADIAAIEVIGARFHLSRDKENAAVAFNALCDLYDAVLFTRETLPEQQESDGEEESLMSKPQNIFYARGVARDERLVARDVAEGRAIGKIIDRFLIGAPAPPPGLEKVLFFVSHDQTDAEKKVLTEGVEKADRVEPHDAETTAREASRCLQCACSDRQACRLRHYGALYQARPRRFQGDRRRLEPDASNGEILYESGKCILCGLCIRIATAAGEERGLSFVGRGFSTRVSVPLGADMAEGLKKAARQCAEACPTAALSLRE